MTGFIFVLPIMLYFDICGRGTGMQFSVIMSFQNFMHENLIMFLDIQNANINYATIKFSSCSKETDTFFFYIYQYEMINFFERVSYEWEKNTPNCGQTRKYIAELSQRVETICLILTHSPSFLQRLNHIFLVIASRQMYTCIWQQLEITKILFFPIYSKY